MKIPATPMKSSKRLSHRIREIIKTKLLTNCGLFTQITEVNEDLASLAEDIRLDAIGEKGDAIIGQAMHVQNTAAKCTLEKLTPIQKSCLCQTADIELNTDYQIAFTSTNLIGDTYVRLQYTPLYLDTNVRAGDKKYKVSPKNALILDNLPDSKKHIATLNRLSKRRDDLISELAEWRTGVNDILALAKTVGDLKYSWPEVVEYLPTEEELVVTGTGVIALDTALLNKHLKK